MQGFFDVKKMPARGLKDDDFQQAIDAGCLDELLVDLPVTQKCGGRNRIFDNMAGYILDKLFSLPACADPYDNSDGTPAALSFICLMTTEGDTTNYQENSTQTQLSYHSVTDSANTSSGAKRFEEDSIQGPWQWSHTGVKQEIYSQCRFLYLPTQGTSNDIRSIGLFFQSDGDNVGTYSIDFGRIGRVRLKEPDGVTHAFLSKNSNEVLLIDYRISLVAV